MKLKRIIPVLFVAILGLGACNNDAAPTSSAEPGQQSESTPAPSSQESQPGKQTPTIAISLDEGKQFNVGEFVAPAVTVAPDSLEKTITYKKGEAAVEAVNPNEIGDYSITVTTAETDQYSVATLTKNFLIRDVPTIKFYVGGKEIQDGYQFALGDDVIIEALPSVPEATIVTTYLNASGELASYPIAEAGLYYCVAEVPLTNEIGAASETISFEVVDASKVTPTIKYYYDGEEKCLESNWLDGGFATSHYDADQFDIEKLSFTVSDEAPYEVSYSLKALNAPESDEGSPIEKPTNPLAPGIYTITVTVNNSALYNQASRWAGFVINDSQGGGGSTPTISDTIKFYYNGEEKCLESNWLDGGFATSHYDASQFDIKKFTYSAPEGSTAAWALKALDAPESTEGSPIAAPTANPLAPGIYTLTITAPNSSYRWAGFVINEGEGGGSQGGGETPTISDTIKFYYNGEEKCLESNWLDEGFVASHYDASQFDINKLTYSAPEGSTAAWALKALDAPESVDGSPIAKPSNPLAPGIYTITVTAPNSSFRWAGFVINDNGQGGGQGGGSTPTVTDTIKFYYDGAEKCLESNWLDEGFVASHYDASQFDINKLTYSGPEGSTAAWTLKALDAPESAEGSPIAKPSNPLAPGIYTITVTAPNSSYRWAGFVINDNGQGGGGSTPVVSDTITFYYNGVEKCLESNWLDEGFAASHYDAANFDINKLTYAAPAGSTEAWTLKALNAPESAEGSPIAKPTANPLAPGIYTITITAPNSSYKWAGFVINDNGQGGGSQGGGSTPTVTDTIKFYYNGEEKCLESNWLDEGFVASHYNASDFDVTKLTYSGPEGSTAAWTLKALDAPESAEGSPIAAPTANPLAPGIYTITVTAPNSTYRWAGFVINDNGQGGGSQGGGSTPAVTDTIKFYYNGVEKCLESNWLDEGFVASHYDAANFDVTKLTFSGPEGSTAAWTLKALDAPEEAEGSPIAAPTANPLAPGIYTITVTAPNSTWRWAGFVINA